jgi:type I restriction enzyme M protein
VIVCASGYNLKDVLNIVNEIDFLNQDDVYTVSHVYETLLKRLGNENKVAGEFYTPRSIIRFMVEVIDPKLGEMIYDPACGSGGFLAGAFDYIRTNNSERTVEQDAFLQAQTFWGNEKKAVPALLGMMNLALHGVTAPKLRRRNTLEEPMKTTPAERFDVVITNPPFGGTENSAVQDNFPVQSNATELLFIEHIMKKLKSGPGKRCAMVVPEGTLFGGGAFATVKKDLLEQFNLYMVVSLPPGSFAPYSDVKTALLFFERPGPTTEVLYYELPIPEGLKKFSKGSPISDEHFDDLRLVWQQWKAYRQQGGERPFGLASDLREQWRVHWLWEACRNDMTGKIVRPEPEKNDSEVAVHAHQAEGPIPSNQINAWAETLDEIQNKNFDLSSSNPHRSSEQDIPKAWELTASLKERIRELSTIIESLDKQLGNGESND